jgi:hypothetical protein
MNDITNEDFSFNTWYFTHTDADGVTNTVEFGADTWVETMNNFITFLRGSGFSIPSDVIGINTDKCIVNDETWFGATFSGNEQ